MADTRSNSSASAIWKRQALRSQSLPIEPYLTTDHDMTGEDNSRRTTTHVTNLQSQSPLSAAADKQSPPPQPPHRSSYPGHRSKHGSNSGGAGHANGAFGRFVRHLLYGSSDETTATTAHSHQQVQVVSRSPPATSRGFVRSLSTISEPARSMTMTATAATHPNLSAIDPALPLSESPPSAASPPPSSAPSTTSSHYPYLTFRRGWRPKSASASSPSFVLAASPVEDDHEYNWTTVSPSTRFSRGGRMTFTHVDGLEGRKRISSLSLTAIPDAIQRDDAAEKETDDDCGDRGHARHCDDRGGGTWWFGGGSYAPGAIAASATHRERPVAKARHSISVFPSRSAMTLDTYRDPYPPHSPMRTGMGGPDGASPPPPPRVDLAGRYADCPRILTSEVASQLRLRLPPLQRLSRRWTLLYSLDQHGISFATMLRRVANKGPMILAVQDEEGQIFARILCIAHG
ncbi:hypothetical protein SYNPS1DRAFT_29141 [Syncephalis pseudoplumigaleata]|uniref:Oxidation resistance protein 1 n=1 Tax=Syncephalis pseudoplumigaleata TaxID=1712513 RepID=A0A4P9YY87_9FUNG|nr:hypothetical protein SYNPS1DRAFT_29141 [Syncephalis pseudoplumigaleata]|eukprot:RKP25113.1 hypothetical protein SYNPS1DRAFT_29141 [Syncephalis pseudoplumigaleata]